VDAAGAGEARAGQAQLLGAQIHPADEGAHGARVVLGESDGRVVARDQQQPVEEGVEPHALAQGQHPHARAPVGERSAGDRHALSRAMPLGDDQRREHLGQAGDW
jgi:hypothetical protein